MEGKISIITRIHSGISKPHESPVSWNVGPRNLLSAVKYLRIHSREMTASYGNVGHKGSHITVCGKRLHDWRACRKM
jgi:hypothetical protein